MKLIRDEIVLVGTLTVDAYCRLYGVPRDEIFDIDKWSGRLPPEGIVDYSQALDFAVTTAVVTNAQTFIFAHEQILAFLAAIDRKLPPGDYPAPFPEMIIQFDRGIDERLFTTGLRVYSPAEDEDEILGLIIAIGEQEVSHIANVIAWYKSTSLNRVALDLRGQGDIVYDPLPGQLATDENRRQLLLEDKQRIANLALLCLAYIHSPGIETEHVQPAPEVNRKRIAKGKRELPDYYICRVHHQRRPGDVATAHSGRHVSFRFDIMGHFRRLPDGRTIWIKPHQRGIEHELYKPKIYKMA